MTDKQLLIEKAWEDEALLDNKEIQQAIHEVIALLDLGKIRVAELLGDGWKVNEWIKKAIMLYFKIQKMEVLETGPFQFYDKIDLKGGYDKLDVRAVPPAIARYGSYIAPEVVLMPSYVNIGAFIGKGSLIDTWASIGSCAQIGSFVNIGGSVDIGGVLVPVQMSPVIIEDHCYIGTGSVIEAGVHISKEAIIATNMVITKTTDIIDVTSIEPMYYRGFIPEHSIVVTGSVTKKFPAGEFNVPVGLIIGKRKQGEDKKATLKEALAKYNVAV